MEVRKKKYGGTTCAAVGCSNSSGKPSCKGKSFHRFPFSNKSILKKWIHHVGRKDWKPSKRSVLCSDHFDKNCYRTSVIMNQFTPSYQLLKKDTVPDQFSHRPQVKSRKSPTKRLTPSMDATGSASAEFQVENDCQETATSHSHPVEDLEVLHDEHSYSMSSKMKSVMIQTDLTMEDITILQDDRERKTRGNYLSKK
ncbi:THAP1 (predicted) [Pycnogonum litorale]